MKSIFVILFFACFYSGLQAQITGCDSLMFHKDMIVNAQYFDYEYVVKSTWLKEEISPDTIYNWAADFLKEYVFPEENMSDSDNRILQKEANYIKLRFDEVINQIGDSISIYYYSTPQVYWNTFKGQDGIVVVKDCLILGKLVLRES